MLPLSFGRSIGKKGAILSTKKLSPVQKELLLNTGAALVEYDAIKIEFVDFKIADTIKNVIFTSQNAVKAFHNKIIGSGTEENKVLRCFCVGKKTKTLLEKNGLRVVECAENALELGKIIAKHHKNESFLFFCGNKRRDELPKVLKEGDIPFKEIEVYKTIINPKAFDRAFDGILFFSPSAVESYMLKNKIGESITFCIGNTTAEEARKHTNNVIIANKPTIENVLVQVAKHFNKRPLV